MNDMLDIAIVGAGPAGLYAAAELARATNPLVRVSLIDRLPSIGGLARAGVAPDHAERRRVIDVYEKLARSSGRLNYYGNVTVGRDLHHEDLLAHHHAVIYASGASANRSLGVPGADFDGCWPSSEFVGWYNGHPDHADLRVRTDCERAVVIGNGNVALDIARLLLRNDDDLATSDMALPARGALAGAQIREVIILGRRGPAHASFTHPELRELRSLQHVAIDIDAADLDAEGPDAGSFTLAQRLACMQRYASMRAANATKRLRFRFLASPLAIHGDTRVTGLTVGRNRLDIDEQGRTYAVATGATEHIATGLIVHAIGYRALPLPDLPFDTHSATVPNDRGRVIANAGGQGRGAYVTGWIKRGPRGVIGSNKQCAAETVSTLLADAAVGHLAPPRHSAADFATLVTNRQPHVVDYHGWKTIDRFERRQAEPGAPRRKLCSIAEMLRVAEKTPATPSRA